MVLGTLRRQQAITQSLLFARLSSDLQSSIRVYVESARQRDAYFDTPDVCVGFAYLITLRFLHSDIT